MAKTAGNEPTGFRDLLAEHSDEVAELTLRRRSSSRQ
jgi:hypothetical protein